MPHHTHNFKVPDSLYHLTDTVISKVIKASELSVVTPERLLAILEANGIESRRVAKNMVSRVSQAELNSIHSEFRKIKASNVIVRDVCYSRARNFITLRYEAVV